MDIIVGSVSINLKDIFKIITGNASENDFNASIIFNFRIPKAITAIIAGAALSVSGLQMQTIFRNPLAGPYVLGISAGAGLGVAILLLGFSSFIPVQFFYGTGSWTVAFAAWLGSGAVLLIIFAVSVKIKDVMTVLIIGVLLGTIISAFITVMQYWGDAQNLKSYVIWSMGSLSGVTKNQLIVLLPAVGIGLIISFLSIKVLDILLLGENYAKGMGVKLFNARLVIFLSTSVLAGSITAFCGPVGFIGIIVPHLARMIFKTAKHRTLIPATALIGAVILLISDL